MTKQAVLRVEDKIGDMLVNAAKKIDASVGVSGREKCNLLDRVTLNIVEILAEIRLLRKMTVVPSEEVK